MYFRCAAGRRAMCVEIVSCLEMCAMAPVITVNGTAHGNLTPETAVELVEQLRA